VNAGSGVLVVQAPGYTTYQSALSLGGGKLQRVQVELVRVGAAELTVRSRQNIEVLLDGEVRGRAPLRLWLAPGNYEVLARSAGYESSRRRLLLTPGERRALDMSLEPTPSLLSRWWFWTGVGVVVVGTVATTIAVTTERSPHVGNIAPGVVTGP